MNSKIYIIKNNNTIEIANVNENTVTEKRTFDSDASNSVVEYLLSLGANIIERNGQKKLKGNFVLYGNNNFLFMKDGEKYRIGAYHRLDYEFFDHGGFIDHSLNDPSVIFGLIKNFDIEELLRVKTYLSKTVFTERELSTVYNDAKQILNRFYPVLFNNGFAEQTIHLCTRLKTDLRILYLHGKISELKLLWDTDTVIRLTEDPNTRTLFFGVLLSFERFIWNYGDDLNNYLPEKSISLIESYKTETELINRKNGIWFIPVGIFWVVHDKLFLHSRSISSDALKTNKSLIIADKVDCGYSHISSWEIHKTDYPDDDFATFPRGRIIYDLNKNEHIIYLDDCVRDNVIREIVRKLRIENYRTAKDEHYSCDQCIRGKNLWED